MPVELPEPIRAAAGLAVTVLGHARHLPENISGLPVRVAGLAMQTSLRLQQSYAGLVVKGDELLTQIQRPDNDDPPWATFDDDVVDTATDMTEGLGADVSAVPPPRRERVSIDRAPAREERSEHRERSEPRHRVSIDRVSAGEERSEPSARTAASNGRPRLGQAPSAFDLVDIDAASAVDPVDRLPNAPVAEASSVGDIPEPVAGYDAMTLAQLRARLRTFDAATLSGLLDYERGKRARATYLTMLQNRINRNLDQS